MSSSTFTQRWTSVHDLTTNSNNNKRLNLFFLQPLSSTDSNAFTFPLRPTQSLISLVEPSSSSSSSSRPSSPHSSGQTKSSSSRVADIINRFESQTISPMSKNQIKGLPRTPSIFTKQWERKSSRTPLNAVIEVPSTSVQSNSKTNNNKAQPIIIYERITNHDRPDKSTSTPPPVSPKSPLVKAWIQNRAKSQQTIESDTDSAVHTMAAVTTTGMNDSIASSRSNTTESSCSSSLSLSTSPSIPHFALPTIASTQKQRDMTSNSTYFKRTSSPPSPTIVTFTRAIPSIPSTSNETPEQSHSSSSSSTNSCISEEILVDEHPQLSSPDTTPSETTLIRNIINTNLPLKYKRDSLIRLYGPDALQQHSTPKSHDVILEDDIDLPFSPRIVNVKKNKAVSDEYELMEFLGRGKFGEVKKCRERATKHLLAAKFIQVHKEQDRIEAYNEIEIMKALQHPRLLQLYDAFETKGDICLIMELISGGELFERVIDDGFILTERLCELYMMQICEGVNFMHSCNIIHLDMKPENILCLNRNGHRIKIIDFGLARKFDPTKQLKVLFGTPEFVAPEVINFDRVGFGTDMWSVGVICYVLLSGLSPFMGENDNDTYANINRANYDFDDEAFTDISDEAKDFISKLLIKNKDKRLQAKQCLAHPWLTRRPKSVATPNDDESAEKKLSTKKLRRFVIRRRWQKAVNALLALKRMGMTL
ncbi:unnamed protein product [Adineta steineri]|uniref:Protein kinase domain-containing protein n=1 Tax=Adineta steineri TaxID=433720 RepID=A0A814ISW7_9BILA|nr:unnamed protein product [Adineta steineri]CAF1101118.1 unnamed protein product [Adineta steineri]